MVWAFQNVWNNRPCYMLRSCVHCSCTVALFHVFLGCLRRRVRCDKHAVRNGTWKWKVLRRPHLRQRKNNITSLGSRSYEGKIVHGPFSVPFIRLHYMFMLVVELQSPPSEKRSNVLGPTHWFRIVFIWLWAHIWKCVWQNPDFYVDVKVMQRGIVTNKHESVQKWK